MIKSRLLFSAVVLYIASFLIVYAIDIDNIKAFIWKILGVLSERP